MSVAEATTWRDQSPNTQSNRVIEYITQYPADDNKVVVVNTDNLDQKVIDAIGRNGLSRFEEFKNYKKGWDNGIGESLSYRSVGMLASFVNQFDDFDTEPSLFFTREGNLQLGWEDEDGQIIELEFFPDRIEYYIESLQEEGFFYISSQNIMGLGSKIKK